MKLFKRIFVSILAVLLCLSFSGCGEVSDNDMKLSIVTTNFPPYDFARSIAGENAEVTMLLSSGEESHTFEPTPQDIIKIKEADIFIAGGGESDEWVRKLVASHEIDKNNIIFMMEISEIENIETNHGHSHDHSEFYEYDEHIWTSPENVKVICKEIAEKLLEIDSQNEEFYTKNLNSYITELNTLDELFKETVEKGKRRTIVFGDRFAFRHFTDLYGLNFYSAFPGCSGETEPDAKTVKELIDKVNEEEIPVVLYKELSNGKVADAICEATGAKKRVLHSCGTVSKEEFESGESYISLMTKNAEILKEALS